MDKTKSLNTSKKEDDLQSSKIKIAFANPTEGIEFNATGDITDELGLDLEDIWVNRSEIENWIGPIPINEYPINVDDNPIIIKKEVKKKFEFNRKIFVKYLEPTTELSKPGDLVINQEASYRPPEAPPLIIYKVPELPATPEPIIIREKPPTPPPIPPQKIITIPGKLLPTPPRTVIYETVINHPCLFCDRMRASQNLKECVLNGLNNTSASNNHTNTIPINFADLKARFSFMSMNDYNTKSKFFSKSNFSIGNFSFNNMNNLLTPMKNSLRSSATNNL